MKITNLVVLTVIALVLSACFRETDRSPLIGTWVSSYIAKENTKVERVLCFFSDGTWQSGNFIHLDDGRKTILEQGTWSVEEGMVAFKTAKSNLSFDPDEVNRYSYDLLNEKTMKIDDEVYTLIDRKPKDLLESDEANEPE